MSKRAVGHTPKMIQNVFVLLLLSLFAILSTFLVTVGAQLYRNTVDSAEKNNNTRIVTAVVRGAIWEQDGGRVEIEPLDYTDAEGTVHHLTSLSVFYEYPDDGETWVKRLYAWDGELLQSFTLHREITSGEDPEDEEPEEDEGGVTRNTLASGETELIHSFNPEYGDMLCELSRFDPSIDRKMLTVELETKDHIADTVRVYLRAGGAEK